MSGALPKTSRRVMVVWFICAAFGVYGLFSIYTYLTASKSAAMANAELLKGRIPEARRHLSQLLLFHPRNPHANLILGKVELAEGATSKAIECFRISAQNADLRKQASLQLARSLALDGQLTVAERHIEDYLLRYKATPAVWDLYFRLLYLQTRTRDVIAIFERKFAIAAPTVQDAGFLLKAEFIPQEPRETLAALRAIHSKHSEDVNVQVALALALMRADEHFRPEQLLRRALKLEPKHPRARIVLAQWLADRQQFVEAAKVLWPRQGYPNVEAREGIAKDDRFWSLSSRLAGQNGEPERALDYVDRALQIRANDKHYLVQRSQILRQLGNRQEATVAAEEAIRAGQVEQELFLIARQLQDAPITRGHCETISKLYRQLDRPMRAELWKTLALAPMPTGGKISTQVGITLP